MTVPFRNHWTSCRQCWQLCRSCALNIFEQEALKFEPWGYNLDCLPCQCSVQKISATVYKIVVANLL